MTLYRSHKLQAAVFHMANLLLFVTDSNVSNCEKQCGSQGHLSLSHICIVRFVCKTPYLDPWKESADCHRQTR